MIRFQKRLTRLLIDALIGLCFSFFLVILLPEFSGPGVFVSAAIVFFVSSISRIKIFDP